MNMKSATSLVCFQARQERRKVVIRGFYFVRCFPQKLFVLFIRWLKVHQKLLSNRWHGL